MAPKSGLARTQRWMQALIMHPGSDEEAVASEVAQAVVPAREFPKVVLPSKTLTSFERLGIYRQMYLARLREALENDFPGVAHFLSDEAFTELVAGYIRVFPSRSYTLNRLGDHFPEYIRSAPGIPRRGFVSDLARLELALSQLFDARESPTLTPKAIAAVPFEAWEKARLKPIEAFRLLSFRYPVSAYLQSVRDGAPHPSTRRNDTRVVAYRRAYRLWRLDLTKPAYELLQALASGLALGEALKEVLRLETLPAEPLTHLSPDGKSDFLLVRTALTGEGFWIVAPVERLPELWQSLVQAARPLGGQAVGFAALEVARIEAGTPRYGADIEENNISQETGQFRALSFTKGCYLGQEIVERVRSRGKVNRKLVGLVAPAGSALRAGMKIAAGDRDGGRDIGRVTSAAHSFALGKPIALAYLRHESSEPGAQVQVEGTTAEVSPLPFPGV